MKEVTSCKMLPLNCNSEGLRASATLELMFTFGKNTEKSDPNENRLKQWMIHNLVSTTRSYNKARKAVVAQSEQSVTTSGTAMFHIFEFSEHIEYCITSLNRLCVAAKQSAKSYKCFADFYDTYNADIESLIKFRNKLEHLHVNVARLQVGKGPIVVKLSQCEGELCLLKERYPVESLKNLIEGYFKALAKLFPSFDVNSKPTEEGVLGLSMTATITTKKRKI